MNMLEGLIRGEHQLAVIGLGYVGLPIALEFARKLKVIGFDNHSRRIELMKKGIDPSRELNNDHFKDRDILFTDDPEVLKKARFFVVAVPTPINEHKQPELEPLLNASHTVGKVLKPGDYVVYESTVYPGCTEEDCIPILEKESDLTYIEDFKVGYSPERINPGDKKHTLTRIAKVTSGCDPESAEVIARIYELIIEAGVHRASSIKVAEAAKIIENTQRDINIAFMNELSMIFNQMNINTYEVLEAAATKWNFLNFYPGLVGGHCIGVDPYYLAYKAREFGHHAQIINAGRAINDGMGAYIARQLVKQLIAVEKNLNRRRVLIMGVTFKENVSDIRNSKVVDLYRELLSFGLSVDVVDPHAITEEVKDEYNIQLIEELNPPYDAIIVAVSHDDYTSKQEDFFVQSTHEDGIILDIKGILRDKVKKRKYWSL